MTDYFYQSRRSRRAPEDEDRRAHEDSRDSPYPPEDESYWTESVADAPEDASPDEPLWYEDRFDDGAARQRLSATSGAWEDAPEDDAGYGVPAPIGAASTASFDLAAESEFPDDRSESEDDGNALLPVATSHRAYVPGGQAAVARAAAASGERNIRFDPTKERGVAYYDAAARHSRNVRLLKIGLPAIAAVAVAGFFLFMTLGEKGDGLPALTLSGIDLDTREITMDKPRISGFDGTKQSYEVTAGKAVQALGNPKVVELEAIDANFGVSDSVRANLLAAAGIYDANTQKLSLDGGVDIKTDNGYVGRLEKADVDIGEGTVFSDAGVMLRGKEGQITSDSIEVLDRGKRIFFRGNVKLHYAPPEDKPPSGTQGDGARPAADTPETKQSVSDGST